MARDIRVLLVKLCDRLDNMRTLEHMKPEAQERIARETMEIYAPLANRLGIQRVKSELEDLSFKYLEPDAYSRASSKLAEDAEGARALHRRASAARSRRALAEQGFAADVTGRAKHLYSIWRKMKAQQCEFEQIYDIIAFRVLRRDAWPTATRRSASSTRSGRRSRAASRTTSRCPSRTCTSRCTRR